MVYILIHTLVYPEDTLDPLLQISGTHHSSFSPIQWHFLFFPGEAHTLAQVSGRKSTADTGFTGFLIV